MELSRNKKLLLMLFAVISAAGFSYLVLPERAGISVVVYVLIQFVFAWFFVPSKKRLFLFVPIFAMSLNCFLSQSHIWRVSNLFVSVVLYCCLFTEPDFYSDGLSYFSDVLTRLFSALSRFALPFRWVLEINMGKTPMVKRVLSALAIALPCAIVLVIILSSADMVFSLKAGHLLSGISKLLNFHTLLLMLCGIFAGLYLFGVVYGSMMPAGEEKERNEFTRQGDLMMINIILSVILFVYTLFVLIQFKYLFAGAVLPQGLTYTEYARKGFFELLALTGINIAAILAVVKLTKAQKGKGALVTKVLCHYLCAVTVVLLISSFYRMLLYTGDDGLTRLRFFVLGFLVFEALGLIVTFFYIAKPKFNVVLCYLLIALSYYTVLNLVPTDRIIAQNQVDKLLQGEREGVDYIFTLSADAAPVMEYLHENTESNEVKIFVRSYLREVCRDDIPQRWQRFNLADERARDIAERLEVWDIPVGK